jgi:hypothetical protein
MRTGSGCVRCIISGYETMTCRTAAQEHGNRMRASGRTYRGGYTRDEIKASYVEPVGEEKNDNPC